jgi:hypothetical protein
MRQRKGAYRVSVGRPEGNKHLGVERRIILKRVFEYSG